MKLLIVYTTQPWSEKNEEDSLSNEAHYAVLIPNSLVSNQKPKLQDHATWCAHYLSAFANTKLRAW